MPLEPATSMMQRALAVSVGNVHVMLEGRRKLDLESLAALRQRLSVGLGGEEEVMVAERLAVRDAVQSG